MAVAITTPMKTPNFLDHFTEACGADAIDFNVKTSCCGGSVSVISPNRTPHLIKSILEAAQNSQADDISTPSPLCQTNVEMYQDMINKKFGTNFNRHSPYAIQIRGNRTTFPPPRELYPLCSHPMA